MASTSIYVCQYCGKKISLTKEEKELMSVIACEECRNEHKKSQGGNADEIVGKVIHAAGNIINQLSGANSEEAEEEPVKYEPVNENLGQRLKTGLKYIFKGEK